MKKFDEKFDGGYDLDSPTIDNPSAGSEVAHYNELKSHLISSIKKAVEVAYKEIEVEKEHEIVGLKIHSTDRAIIKDRYAQGYNYCLSLIEKKKSLFLNNN